MHDLSPHGKGNSCLTKLFGGLCYKKSGGSITHLHTWRQDGRHNRFPFKFPWYGINLAVCQALFYWSVTVTLSCTWSYSHVAYLHNRQRDVMATNYGLVHQKSTLPQWKIYWKLRENYSIADVALTIRHRRLDEIFIYFNGHFIQELNKHVFKKIVSYNMPAKLDAIMFAQHMLVINAQEMGAFHTAQVCYKCARFWHSFRVNSFADFLFSAGKKILSSSSRWWRFVTAKSAIRLASRTLPHESKFCTEGLWISNGVTQHAIPF